LKAHERRIKVRQENAMPASANFNFLQARSPRQVETIRQLFGEYADAIGVDLEYQGFSAELAALPAPYQPPQGALLVASTDAAVAGCVALRRLDEHAGEMKRLYVRPQFRGSGLGRQLIERVIIAAREAGYDELRLDTLPSMIAAQDLYRKLGFRPIAAYNNHHLPGTRFYALTLSA
jgi:putative acetyltransferase